MIILAAALYMGVCVCVCVRVQEEQEIVFCTLCKKIFFFLTVIPREELHELFSSKPQYEKNVFLYFKETAMHMSKS